MDLSKYGYLIIPLAISIFSFFIYFLSKKYLIPLLNSIFSTRNKKWKPIFEKRDTFKQISYLTPIISIYFGLQYVPDFAHYANRVLNFYISVNITFFLNAIISTFIEIYNLYPLSKERPLKSYAQMFSIIIYIIGFVIAICSLLDKDPWVFISGIGALTAVVVLVFRDTILSFIAGIQILTNNLIKKDDWIEVPSFGANGAVIDVALHVIKVQNWDKTVVTIPTYKVIESGFKNWRGMYNSGGRRIKRSILIDQRSIAFIGEDDLISLCRHPHLYEIMKKAHSEEKGNDGYLKKTNLGVFRSYVEAYLRNHPRINQDLTFIIRLLDPSPTGIPLEFYLFSKDTEWAKYEHIQSEISEHLIAVLPLFKLEIYQYPTDRRFSNATIFHEVLERFPQAV